MLAFLLGRWTGDGDARPTASSRDRHIPAEVHGTPLVLDGDTIDFDGLRVRLFGVDAPERDQLCEREDGSRYACGQFAREMLVALIANAPVRCTRRDVDPYGRMVGVCSGAEADLSAALVEHGAAMAYRHYSLDYVKNEDTARSFARGIWAGRFEAPWDYRHKGKSGQAGK